MASPPTPSLPTALSQALIAFTIEFDNEFEHRVEHHTGNKAGRGVWLTSMAMWSNFMRLIPAGGVALNAVEANGRITNLGGLQRWGYISVEPADQTVHLKPGGRRAQEVWRPLAGEVEQRWRERFGDAAIDELRQALSSVADPALPLYLPVLGYADGMRAGHVRAAPGAVAEDLAALLSQALLSFTLEYEDESDLSLALSANVVRVLSADGVPVRDLPARSGVSKEAITAAVGFLQRNGYAAVEPDPASRSKLVRLTEQGPGGTGAARPPGQGRRAALAKAPRRRLRPAGQGAHHRPATRARPAALSGRLAGGAQPIPGANRGRAGRPGVGSAAVPDGPAPGRLPGRKLVHRTTGPQRPTTSRGGGCASTRASASRPSTAGRRRRRCPQRSRSRRGSVAARIAVHGRAVLALVLSDLSCLVHGFTGAELCRRERSLRPRA